MQRQGNYESMRQYLAEQASEGFLKFVGFWESLRRFVIGTVDGSEIPRPTTVWMYKTL